MKAEDELLDILVDLEMISKENRDIMKRMNRQLSESFIVFATKSKGKSLTERLKVYRKEFYTKQSLDREFNSVSDIMYKLLGERDRRNPVDVKKESVRKAQAKYEAKPERRVRSATFFKESNAKK